MTGSARSSDLAELRARVLDAARREPARPRSAGAPRRRWVIALGFVSMVAIAAFLVAERHDPGRRPPGYVAALTVAWLFLASGATWAGLARGRSMLGRSAAWRVGVAALTPIAMLASWLPIALVWPNTLSDASTMRTHLTCVGMTLAFAAGPLVAFAVLRRESDPVRPGLTAAAMGVVAGAWGAVALVMFCGFSSPAHILVGHVLPVALLAVASALVLRRVVEVRQRRG